MDPLDAAPPQSLWVIKFDGIFSLCRSMMQSYLLVLWCSLAFYFHSWISMTRLINFGLSNSLAILLYGSMMYIIAPGYQIHWHLIHDAANCLCYQFHCHFHSWIHDTVNSLRYPISQPFSRAKYSHYHHLFDWYSLQRTNTNNTDTKKNKLYLNTGASDDAHEKVRNNTGDCHHKALHTSDACKEHEHKVNKVVPTRMQLHHEVNNWTWYNGYQEQKWKGWERIPNDKRRHSIVPIQPLPTKHLQNKQNWKPPSLVIVS